MATLVTRSGKGSPLTHAEVDANFTNLNTDKLELSGGTMTGNLSFGDNDKAIFGAGSDLQIYHDGSNSYVNDAGAGNLILGGSSQVTIGTVGVSTSGVFKTSAEVVLYHNNVAKFQTTSTGADITGTLTSDGLTVARAGGSVGSSNVAYIDVTSSYGGLSINASTGNNAFIELMENGVKTAGFNSDATNNVTSVQSANSHALAFNTGSTNERMRITSDGSVGIGTSSPSQKLEVSDTTNQNVVVRVANNDGNAEMQKYQDDLYLNLNDTGNIIVRSGSPIAERMRIDSSGNLLVGRTSSSGTAEGIRLLNDGFGGFHRDSAEVIQVDRKTDDGVLISLRKDGSEVGSIGTRLGRLKVGYSDVGLFFDNSNDRINPEGPDNTGARDAAIDLGHSGGRFKDLYLSGDVDTSGVFKGTNGTASVPTHSFLNDPDNGMFRPTTNTVGFSTAGSEAMRIDSSGNVGIGVVPKTGGSTWQHIQFGGTGNIVSRFSDTTGDAMFANNYYVNSSGTDSYIANGSASRLFLNDNEFRFDIAGSGTADAAITFTRAMTLDSSGNLLVGVTSDTDSTNVGVRAKADGFLGATRAGSSTQPTAYFNKKTNDGVIAGFYKDGTTVGSIGATTGVLTVGNANTGGVIFGYNAGHTFIEPSNTSGASTDDLATLGSGTKRFRDLYLSGGTKYGSSTDFGQIRKTGGELQIDSYGSGGARNPIKFTQYTSEAARFDSSGNLLVGRTSTAFSGTGHIVQSNGIVYHMVDGAAVQYLRRNTSDGDIVRFYKDTTEVGSIGNTGSRMYLGSGDVGAAFQSDVDKRFYPVDPSNGGAGKDAYIDLGRNNVRWKDLYLSGGVYLGGTGSANKLDDYEEGHFTATLTPTSGGSITLKTSQDRLSYTKIGNFVHIGGRLDVSSVSSPTGALKLTLPFTTKNGDDLSGEQASAVWIYNLTSDVTGYYVMGRTEEGNTNYLIEAVKGDSSPLNLADRIQANSIIRFGIVYQSA